MGLAGHRYSPTLTRQKWDRPGRGTAEPLLRAGVPLGGEAGGREVRKREHRVTEAKNVLSGLEGDPCGGQGLGSPPVQPDPEEEEQQHEAR